MLLAVGAVAALGGFARSDRPLPAYDVGERVELGQFAWTVHGASVVDQDEDGDPFDDKPLRVLVDATVELIGEESDGLSSGMLGVRPVDGETLPSEGISDEFHPGLPRRVQIEVPLDEEALGSVLPERTDVWLAASEYGWTNLSQPGPAWSAHIWSGIVADVPLSDDRGPR